MKNKFSDKTQTAGTGKDILKLFHARHKKQGSEQTRPAGEVEILLHNMWQDLLHHENFGTNDDFFQVGGNSIKGIQLVARVNRQFLVHTDLTDLFLNPTITQIAALITERQKKVSQSAIVAIHPRPDRIPLSFSQERLWFIDKLEGSVQYHLPIILRFKGAINKIALGQAFQRVVDRHEALRTVIMELEGQAAQKISEKGKWKLEQVDGSIFGGNEESLASYIDGLVTSPFDLSQDHMLRCTLLTFDAAEHLLVVTMHHIAADAWSMSVIVKETIQLYETFIAGEEDDLPKLQVQYADYAIWQRTYLQGDLLNKKLDYWRENLRDVAALQLPTDYNRPAVQKGGGAALEFIVEKELSTAIENLCHQEGTTVFMTLLAAFNVLLHRYSNQQDICVGTSIASRPQHDLENLIGFFVNTLALRTEVDGNESFRELLQRVKATTIGAYANQEVPFEKVVDAVVRERDMSRSPLFQVMLVLQDTLDIPELKLGGVQLTQEAYNQNIAKFEITFFVSQTAEGLRGSAQYRTDLFSEETMSRMVLHFKELLKSIISAPEQKVGELAMLTTPEEIVLLNNFNNSVVSYPKDKSISDLFEEQAAKTPTATALVFEEEELTYEQLNERSNQLAHYLVSKGVKEEELVPVCMERGLEMMIAMLGILKAGAAYVPIDTDFPQDRIAYMLEDTRARIALTTEAAAEKLQTSIEIIELDTDWNKIARQPKTNPGIAKAGNLAYVIYTSGSTGKPKGVMIEHRSLVDYVFGLKQNVQIINECKTFALVSTIATDLGNTVIFSSLLLGGALHIFAKESVSNTEHLHRYFRQHGIDCLKIVPSHWKALVNDEKLLLPNKLLVFGGEALQANVIDSIRQTGTTCQVINHYGPTETTIGKLLHVVNRDRQYTGTVPIGKPFSNARVYVLSKDLQLCPIGVAGQLYIAGDGTARGYVNNETLTNEKFITDPFIDHSLLTIHQHPPSSIQHPVSRMYGTGDLVKWLPDGNIEFIGRVDNQVKIRGYRIELGEIETILEQSDLVSQAVVLAREDKQGNKRLIGYIIPEGYYDREGIIAYLKDKLPDYMVPALLMEMESFPLTANGKIDRKALPDPDAGELLNNQYAAPRNEAEQVLAGVWQDVLGADQVGIHDDFFELGGDSIITIQVVSRARRLGYELQVGDIFNYPTIASLSALIDQRADTETSVTGEQSVLTGTSGLLPIQQWFLENEQPNPSHFNQSVLLSIDKKITEPVLKAAVKQLMVHHDALRFKYYQVEGTWQQAYSDAEGAVITEDLKTIPTDQLANTITEKADSYQRSLDIEKGELVRVVWMQTPQGETANRLLLIIHHLAVDGVSWRILLEDLELLLTGQVEGGKTSLGHKASSYRQWYEALENWGQTKKLNNQKAYWQDIKQSYQPIRTDKAKANTDSKTKARDTRHHSIKLSEAKTQQLLQEVPRVYHTQINDILLAALAGTLCQYSKQDKITIGMEGHGREEIKEGIDTSRTIGWFTTHYPVLLQTQQETGELIKSVKEQLRTVPDRGLGYGVLKYINKEETLQGQEPWDIIFNYLGQLDNVVSQSKWLTAATESQGQGRSEEYGISEKLVVNSLVQSGELTLSWSYSSLYFEQETIEQLAQEYITQLEAIITHCISKQQQGESIYTPSDYGLAPQVGYKELDKFLEEPFKGKKRKDWIEAIYRLSGLQQGMLFHSLYDGGAGAYTEQFTCDLTGVDVLVLNKSWEKLLQHHTILRSAFYYEVFQLPVQCVCKEVALPIELLDYQHLSETEQAAAIQTYQLADLEKGFNLSEAPLMRLTLIQLDGARYRMLWTWNHILFDGWSLAILMEEFLNVYESLVNNKPTPIIAADKYEDYIRYIERADKEQEEHYWKTYLKQVQESSLLPFIAANRDRTRGAAPYSAHTLQIDTASTARIQNFAQKNRLTVNTIMQGTWSALLHQYTGNNDIAYGVIVSGRPDDLAGVEKRVGMYINTLPLHSELKDGQPVLEWLQQIQAEQVISRDHQHTPLQEVQGWSNVQGDLFDSLMVFENYPISKVVGANQWSLQVSNPHKDDQSNYPLTIIISNADEITVKFSYNKELLKEEHVRKVSAHFEHVLLQLINENLNVGDLKIITDTEEQQLLHEFNNTKAIYPTGSSLIELFEQQVAKTPTATALVFEEEKLSYQQLNERSNQLANYLAEKNIAPGQNIGLLSLRRTEMIIGMLGILKAGCAYVPFNTQYPAERLKYIIEDAAINFIVATDKELVNTCGLADHEIVYLDESIQSATQATSIKTGIDACVYVMYTSGTTGRPKGIAVSNRNVIKLVYEQCDIAVKSEDRMLQWSNYSFDGSIYEIYSSLLLGASLHLIKDDWASDVMELGRVITEQNISVCFITTALFNSFVDVNLHSLTGIRKILFGGEMVSLSHVTRALALLGPNKIVHVYGPTETTVYATYYPINSIGEDGIIPIGKPLSNTTAFIVNPKGQLVPIGVPGELYLGGDGVSLGYLNNKELSAEKFVTNVLGQKDRRFYRSGDLCRWTLEGQIEYLGRIDNQVKVRGFRIEPAEIETVLIQTGLVSQAVVLVKEDKQGHKRLVGYIVANGTFDKQAVISSLLGKLPDYMVPALWVELKSLPLTPNGKIDKRALPEPDASGLLTNEYVAPRNELEIQLATIWKQLLDVQQVGINDNFFELGGDSIITIQVVSRARRLGYELYPKDIFVHQTIGRLSQAMAERTGAVVNGEQGLLTGLSGLLPIQQWYLDANQPEVSHFNQSILIGISKSVTEQILSEAIKQLMAHHDALRFKYYQTDNAWQQEYGDHAGLLFTEDLRSNSVGSSRVDLQACKLEYSIVSPK